MDSAAVRSLMDMESVEAVGESPDRRRNEDEVRSLIKPDQATETGVLRGTLQLGDGLGRALEQAGQRANGALAAFHRITSGHAMSAT